MARPTRRQQFLNMLRDCGGRSSNPALQSRLNWDSETYWRVHTDLFEEGVIEKGRGYGGTVLLAEVPPSVPSEDSIAFQPTSLHPEGKPERDLYEPVLKQIQANWHHGQRLDSCHAEIVAQQGSRDTGGNWSRPDIALLALKTFEYLPNRIMEIHTFEIKPDYEINVKGVMEALTHREFSTRAFVIYHTAGKEFSDLPESARIESLAARHGIGVYSAKNVEDFSTWGEIVPAVRTNPDPDAMELFIKRSLGEKTKSTILKWLK